jgi:hypothetical protein
LRRADGTAWPRQLIVNLTNGRELLRLFGRDAEAWADRYIDLWAVEAPFGPGIRVGAVAPAPARRSGGKLRAVADAEPAATPRADLDDEIPF